MVSNAKDLLPSLDNNKTSPEEGALNGPPSWKDAQEHTQKRSKVPAIRYPSDDCILYLGRELDAEGEVLVEGTGYPLHEGEWVELQPILTVKALLELNILREGSTEESLKQASAMVAERISAWSWTNLEYETLSNPPSADDVLNLSDDEWIYLINLLSTGIAGTGTSKNA